MGTNQNDLPCDGCGLPASPGHIAERLRRLELSTRYRPVHIGVLFVALAPADRLEDDFYAPAGSNEFFDPFLDALEIQSLGDNTGGNPGTELDAKRTDSARLTEFQRRGFYLTYLSECSIQDNQESAASTIARLSQTLVRRIRFNYKPKHIVLLGQELSPLTDILRVAGIGPVVTLEHGLALPAPGARKREWIELFRGAMATVAPRDHLSPGYDRIQLTSSD